MTAALASCGGGGGSSGSASQTGSSRAAGSTTTAPPSPGSQLSGQVPFTDANGYTYTVNADLNLGKATTSVQFATPGTTDVVTPISGTIQITNTTNGRDATISGGVMGAAALFNGDRPICQAAAADRSDNDTFDFSSVASDPPGLAGPYCAIYVGGYLARSNGVAYMSIASGSTIEESVSAPRSETKTAPIYSTGSNVLTAADSNATTVVSDIDRGPDAWALLGDFSMASPSGCTHDTPHFFNFGASLTVYGVRTADGMLKPVSC